MSRRIELAIERGRLLERIAAQRQQLAVQAVPLARTLGRTDRAVAATRASVNWLKAHPGAVGVGVALLFLRKPLRYVRWGKKGLTLWKQWRKVRELLGR